MVSIPSGRRIWNCKRSTACKFAARSEKSEPPILHFRLLTILKKTHLPQNKPPQKLLQESTNIDTEHSKKKTYKQNSYLLQSPNVIYLFGQIVVDKELLVTCSDLT